MRWTHASLRTQFLLALSAIAVTLGNVVGDRERERLEQREAALYRTTLQTLGAIMIDAVVAEDSALLKEIVERTADQHEGVVHLGVTNRLGRVLAGWQRAGVGAQQTFPIMRQSIDLAGHVVGEISLELDPAPLERAVRVRVWEVRAALTMSLLLVVICVGCLIYQLAIRPLHQIDERVRLLRERGRGRSAGLQRGV